MATPAIGIDLGTTVSKWQAKPICFVSFLSRCSDTETSFVLSCAATALSENLHQRFGRRRKLTAFEVPKHGVWSRKVGHSKALEICLPLSTSLNFDSTSCSTAALAHGSTTESRSFQTIRATEQRPALLPSRTRSDLSVRCTSQLS